jgi:hypothetical protein
MIKKIGAGDIKRATYTKRQKSLIVKKLFKDISVEDAEEEFASLREVLCKVDKSFKPFSRVGNKVVDLYTRDERIDTQGKKGMTFFDFVYNKKEFLQKPYIQKILASSDLDEMRGLFKAFQVYYGSVNIFRPIIAMEFYCKFKPKSILDFTMGWGGRLVGAAALNIPKYIGIDMNPDLVAPYAKLENFLKDKTSTDIKLIFKNALNVDYTKLDYDMVFTSPPYYNVEIYKGTERKSKDDWDKEFYEPIIKMTYGGMKKGGWYCLNIPEEVYERVAKLVLGKATKMEQFRKGIRGVKGGTESYGEMVYCWNK